MSETVRTEIRPDGVAILTLDQPGSKVNVLSEPLLADLEAAIDAVAARTDIRGLVIASAKPGIFIAGADLKVFANAPGPNDPAVRAFIGHGLRVLEKLEAVPFPTCAAIDGAALGGGLEVPLACDLRIVGTNPKVRLGLPEVALGLIPGWGGTQRLPRLIRIEDAFEIMVVNAIADAGTAVRRGLAAHAMSGEDLVKDAADRVRALYERGGWMERRAAKFQPIPLEARAAFNPPAGLTGAAAEAARVMVEGAALPLYEGIKLETEAFLRLAGAPESRRLIAEFFASRKK